MTVPNGDRACDVELHAVTKRLGSLTAVNAVTLKVRKGEFLSLLGPSGCARLDQLAADAQHGCDRDELPQLQDPDAERAGSAVPGPAGRPHVQRAEDLHRQLPLHPQRQPQVVQARTQIYTEFKAA
jgi:hypothetical protein